MGTKLQPGPYTTGCSRPTCKGNIHTGTLVHKLSIGQHPCCRVCEACGQKKRYFRLPPGSDLNPLHYTRPGKKNAPALQQHNKAPRSYAQVAHTALEAENKLLREHLASQGLQVPLPEPVENDNNLEDLRAGLELLKKLGENTSSMEAKIAAAEAAAEQNKSRPDLLVVLKKLKWAEAQATQCTNHYNKVAEQLEAAKAKAVQSELALKEIQDERDKLMSEKGFQPKTQDFPPPPQGMDEEAGVQWTTMFETHNKLQQEQQKAFLVQLDAFKQTFLRAKEENTQQKPAEKGEALQGAGLAKDEKTSPAPATGGPMEDVAQTLLQSSEEREQALDVAGNFKRLREKEAEAAFEERAKAAKAGKKGGVEDATQAASTNGGA